VQDEPRRATTYPFLVREVDSGEIDAFVGCLDAGFGMQSSPLRKERFVAGLHDAHALGAFDGGELAGTFASYQIELTLPGLVLSDVAAVSDVTVLPTHRRRGALSALMSTFLAHSHESGEVFALLHASEGAIYGRFGFGPTTWSARYVIEHSSAALSDRAQASLSGSVHLLSPAQARESFPLVYDSMRQSRPGEIARLELWWDDLFDDLDSQDRLPRFYACHESDGTIDGYVIYEISGLLMQGVQREAVLVELVVLSRAAYVALYSFLCGIDLVTRTKTLARPVAEPFRHCLADPRALQTQSVEDRTWMRFIDVAKALGSRRYEGPGSLVFELHDEQCPWNEGRYCLDVAGDGTAQVSVTGRSADLECGIAGLAAGYLGATPFVSLAFSGEIAERSDGAARRADVLFAATPPAFCTAVF